MWSPRNTQVLLLFQKEEYKVAGQFEDGKSKFPTTHSSFDMGTWNIQGLPVKKMMHLSNIV